MLSATSDANTARQAASGAATSALWIIHRSSEGPRLKHED